MSRGDPLRARDYLEHIAEAIANIREYTAGMDAVAYLADRKTQDAVVRTFEVIGEACNNVTKHNPEESMRTSWRIGRTMRRARPCSTRWAGMKDSWGK